MSSWIYQHVRQSLFKQSVKIAWRNGKIQLIRLQERNSLICAALVASWQLQQKETSHNLHVHFLSNVGPQCCLLCSNLSVLRTTKAERRLLVAWTEKSVLCLWTASLAWIGTFSFFIPWKSIAIHLNNKPWVSKSVKNMITQRNISFY